MTLLKITTITVSLVASLAFANVPGPSGCYQAQNYLSILKLYSITHHLDAESLIREMNFVKTQACTGVYSDSSTVTYRNGVTATSLAGNETSTWYWPNGSIITSLALGKNATVYYPNGTTATSLFFNPNATFYYADGSILSSFIGKKNATLYIKGVGSVNSPGFINPNGDLDVISMADYVDSITDNGNSPISCDNKSMKLNIQDAINKFNLGQSSNAIHILNQVKSCL